MPFEKLVLSNAHLQLSKCPIFMRILTHRDFPARGICKFCYVRLGLAMKRSYALFSTISLHTHPSLKAFRMRSGSCWSLTHHPKYRYLERNGPHYRWKHVVVSLNFEAFFTRCADGLVGADWESRIIATLFP